MQSAKTNLITRHDESSIKTRESTESNERLSILATWRFTVASGAFAGAVILLLNIITLAVMYSKHDVAYQSITFFTGSCRKANNISIGAHIVINVLSTVLLAYSNFSMQCLGSPTRGEVDRAHAKKYWLSIGTPTVRNLFFVSRMKALLWITLALSSFPLHLIWNSTVFYTQSTNDYISVTVTEQFQHGGNWTLPPFNEESRGSQTWENDQYEEIIKGLQEDMTESKLERLNAPDCFDAYHTEMLSDRLHVLAVVDDSFPVQSEKSTDAEKPSVLAVYNNRYPGASFSGGPLYGWMCDSQSENWWDTCLTSDDRNRWVPGGRPGDGEMLGSQRDLPVRHCYSQRSPAQCKVDIIPGFLIIVIVCNVVKIACFLFTLRIVRTDHPLCTTGDAVQSFLERPDKYTQNHCLASKPDFGKGFSKSNRWKPRAPGDADTWAGKRHRWAKAVRWWQWALYTALVSALTILTGVKLCNINSDWAVAASYSIGEPHPGLEILDFYIPNTLRGFLIANTPQLVLSYMYLALNNIMTTMLAMDEWCGYSVASSKPPKGLRVSTPVANSAQRSTYFLSVPYKWSIPSTAALTVLHWLVSQMFFYAKVDVYGLEHGGYQTLAQTMSYIYLSPLAALLAVCLGGGIVIAVVLIGMFKRYPATPLAGGCSASIAAACQPSHSYEHGIPNDCSSMDLALKELKWGIVQSSADEVGLGHGTFCHERPEPLVTGNLYA